MERERERVRERESGLCTKLHMNRKKFILIRKKFTLIRVSIISEMFR